MCFGVAGWNGLGVVALGVVLGLAATAMPGKNR